MFATDPILHNRVAELRLKEQLCPEADIFCAVRNFAKRRLRTCDFWLATRERRRHWGVAPVHFGNTVVLASAGRRYLREKAQAETVSRLPEGTPEQALVDMKSSDLKERESRR